MFLLRLDDASEYMDLSKWSRMHDLLTKYGIKPVFGIIPDNQNEELKEYGRVPAFYKMVSEWIQEGWIPALHGYDHVYLTKEGGLNPVNRVSEFAGVDYEVQKKKIEMGIEILKQQGIAPEIFFAPSHTFDENTLKALHEASNIRIISDTVAYDQYYDPKSDFFFLPQQTGRVRKLPFRFVTFCYHPNTMRDEMFDELEEFIKEYREQFIAFSSKMLKKRSFGVMDLLLRKMYFFRRRSK